MSSQEKEFVKQLAGRELRLTVGKLAGQADAAVTVRYGDTVVLATCVLGPPRPGVDYMPLLVEYEEKFYAAGKIKGSRFVKREGKPTDLAITTGRLIDRSIRPLFPKRMRDDVQVVTTVLSYDEKNEPDVLSLIGASAALAVSRIPWDGPLGAVRVGRRDGAWVINPTAEELDASDLSLMVAATKDEVVMLEASANELKEAELLLAIDAGTAAAREVAAFIGEIQRKLGQAKVEPHWFTLPEALVAQVRGEAWKELEKILAEGGAKLTIQARINALTERLVERFGDSEERKADVRIMCRDLHREIVREWVLNEKKRIGGRGPEDLRPISVEVGVLPRTHGSALFQRGETQILSITTLGAPDDIMILDTMTEEDTKKHFFHFYNMPGFSVGEIRPNRGPGRRDIGHGALAEHALTALIPGRETFPYTVMVVSEVLSSNGSSSMGSACGASLALMDAGVPIARHVAGIAMGLVTDEHERGRAPVVLTDIAGMEDEGGDMDFKMAGTRQGITALQVDIKLHGLPRSVIEHAIAGARAAREQILDVMERAIAAPRPELSPYAPRIVTLMVKPEKIRDIIGPRGTTINKIVEETGVDMTVEDDGQVFITSTDAAGIEKAVEWVKMLTREVVPGEEFVGKVTRLMRFGAFVELFPGNEGLVHISEFGSRDSVRRIEDVVSVGDTLSVVVKEIDDQGRTNLSLKNAPRPPERGPGGEAGGPPGRFHSRRPFRRGGRDDRR